MMGIGNKRMAGTILPAAALAVAACGVLFTGSARGYFLLGFGLPIGQRDFRVFNNFTSHNANGNQTPDANFPGYQGALMAVWKGCVEWQSRLHGNGGGDPHQPGGIGSGGANFDPSFQGDAIEIGGLNDNTHSQISGCNGGILETLKWAAMAEMHEVQIAPHHVGSPVSLLACCHLAACCPNFLIQECNADPRSPFFHELFGELPQLEDGCMTLSDKPGLGIELNEEAAAEYPYKPFDRRVVTSPDGGIGII